MHSVGAYVNHKLWERIVQRGAYVKALREKKQQAERAEAKAKAKA
jgi:hypothetical protein